MIRILMLSLLLAAAAAMAAYADDAGTMTNLGVAPESQPRNDTVTINRPFVRLGDLFPEAGDKADIAVAYAPAPGSRTVYDVKSLVSIARSNGIQWQAKSWFDRVVIERPGIAIGDNEIMAAVRSELAKRNLDAKADIDLATHGISLFIPADAPTALELQNFQFDERSGQFTSRLVVPAADGTQAIAVSGRIYRLVDVPTLNRRVSSGEIVARDDIQWQTARAETVGRNVILDADKIIGKEAIRPLPSDQPVRNGDVRPPVIVNKGSLVTMIVQSPTMTLTSKGKAMENGAMGDAVRIENTQSKVVVEGEVVSNGTVRIASLQPAPLPGDAQ
jgi:flagella basal body P-ring formation protein FlgA